MKRAFWLGAAIVVVVATLACGGEKEQTPLPPTYTIVKNGNLYDATVTLCGSINAADKEGRGRWRRWRNADARIAVAPMHHSRAWGWVITIQPGTYKVPSDLCEDESNRAGIIALILAVIGGLITVLVFRERRSRKQGGRPRVATAHARS